ncbi:glycosyltransferase family 4 protein [Vibrio vulnificus]|nr:glycosyltransferase family 4 protein [Vibrio vulnificus]EKO5187866.1 glycosyltransferase family 4 protein [Vibrio vulnificus]ELH7806354.1 glycosyltransferase family 4 protein [Vibrio vulnificus]
MKSKILMIGPFPEPIHGMSLSNKIIYDNLLSRSDIDVHKFDITLNRKLKSKSTQGKLNFLPVLSAILNLIKMIAFLFYYRKSICYFTPPQSAYGYLRIVPGMLFSKLFGGKVIVHMHGAKFISYLDQAHDLVKRINLWSLRYVDDFIVLGRSLKDSHSHVVDVTKIRVCENGVPDPKYQPSRKEDGKINVLFLSNLMKDKGIFEFLDAVEEIDDDRYDFSVAGCIETTNKREIEEKLNKLGSKITYHGLVGGSVKESLFKNADIFVLPSYDEGQPLSILEAYSYGCAVLVTNVGGVCDIFSDEINGRFIKIGSSSSISSSIKDMTRAEMAKFGNVNIQYYYEHFTEKDFVERILNILFD